jgi:alginate O-acetyltransferase complex protein AlgI
MVFSSTIFLFLFLPLTLLVYLLVGRSVRNLILLAASLAFYAWGENIFVLLMLGSILVNYVFGLLIDRAQKRGGTGRGALVCAVAANLGLLGFFKYANFIVDNLNTVLAALQLEPVTLQEVHLPIGISFFTFQALSYVIDLYRRDAQVQKNPINIALYISLFPQLIAGPIVRYHDIATQIALRTTSFADFGYGVRRFIIGLGKKVLLANVLGRAADYIFSLPPDRIPVTLAWLGAISYTLQIYYDFSGYSDMAIGLGRMFGFRFLENFNYPYISRSIREFWRRWHISLSSWFRDYLYFPLGGSRQGAARTYMNLVVVFFLCGLWHGASWTFVGWGLYHGIFLVLERVRPGRFLLDLMPAFVRHLYVLLVVIVGWVFFRAETMEYALGYLGAMVDFSTPPLYNSQIFLNLNTEFYLVLIIAIIGSAPVFPRLEKWVDAWVPAAPSGSGRAACTVVSGAGICFFTFVFLYSVASIMGGAYNPFLYFRF